MQLAAPHAAYNGSSASDPAGLDPVPDLSAMHDQQHVRVLLELLQTSSQFAGHPQIVLVTPSDHIASAQARCLKEVRPVAELCRIVDESHFEGGFTTESLDYLNRLVHRTVIEDDHLGGLSGLGSDARQLRGQETRSVVVAIATETDTVATRVISSDRFAPSFRPGLPLCSPRHVPERPAQDSGGTADTGVLHALRAGRSERPYRLATAHRSCIIPRWAGPRARDSKGRGWRILRVHEFKPRCSNAHTALSSER